MTTIKCISSMATQKLLQSLCSRWSASTGNLVELESVGGVDAAKRIAQNESFDLAVLAHDALQKLESSGHVGAITPFTVSQVAVAAAEGKSPKISTRQELLQAMRDARAIGYSTGPSGKALLSLLETWGAMDVLKSKLIQAPAGVAVGKLIADGTVDFGFQQLSELIHCPGISLLGPMPPGDEIPTTFSASVCTASTHADISAAFVSYICSPQVAEFVRLEGMDSAAAPV